MAPINICLYYFFHLNRTVEFSRKPTYLFIMGAYAQYQFSRLNVWRNLRVVRLKKKNAFTDRNSDEKF